MFFNQCVEEKKKVRARDIQENILKIQETMRYTEGEIQKTIDELKTINKDTEDGRLRYNRLQADLTDMNALYKALQEMEEKQYGILKKYKDSKFFIQPKDWLVIGGMTFLAVIVIALDRESPKITKLISLILKMLPLHI